MAARRACVFPPPDFRTSRVRFSARPRFKVAGRFVMTRTCRAGKQRTAVRNDRCIPSARRRREDADATTAGRTSEGARGGRYPREDLQRRHR